jgi:hypothetical protein
MVEHSPKSEEEKNKPNLMGLSDFEMVVLFCITYPPVVLFSILAWRSQLGILMSMRSRKLLKGRR